MTSLSPPSGALLARHAPDWAASLLGSLHNAAGAPWEVWIRMESQRWERPTDNADDELLSVGLEFDEAWIDRLEESFERAAVLSYDLSPGFRAVLAPLTTISGRVGGVAVLATPAEEQGHVMQLAEIALEMHAQRLELDRLRKENEYFAQQVNDDFEEMTFLRIMAEQLAVDDASLGIDQVVELSLEMLHGILGAEALGFVEESTNAPPKCRLFRRWPSPTSDLTEESIEALGHEICCEVMRGPFVDNQWTTKHNANEFPGVRQLLIVPVATTVRRFGWFVAVNRRNGLTSHGKAPLLCASEHEFGTWEASLLNTAATVIASHASNLEHLREKGNLLVSVVRSLVSAVEAKDAYTCGHSERVALYTKRIAEQVGYDEDAAERIYLTGLLHDVGKIGVSDATLNKPGKLTVAEFAEIQQHPDYGWAILCELRQLGYVLPGVLHHHERYDGAGYPDGLKGDQIPLDARLMAVADAYDAMTSDRAYRRGLPHDKAVAIIRDGAGTQWDPAAVEAFLAVLDDIVDIRDNYQQHERPVRCGSALQPT